MNRPKHIPLFLWWLCDYELPNLNNKTCCCDFASLKMSNSFQRLVKNYNLLLHFLKAWQSLLIRNIKFLTFSFVTNTLHDVLDKAGYQNNINWSTNLTNDHWVRLAWKMLTHDNIANPDYHKLFWLANFWVDNIHFPAHHKRSVKTNKNQPIITTKVYLIPRKNVITDYRDPDEMLPHIKDWVTSQG